eukprot:9364136-Alexandrium_andersonii.AAC.1
MQRATVVRSRWASSEASSSLFNTQCNHATKSQAALRRDATQLFLTTALDPRGLELLAPTHRGEHAACNNCACSAGGRA